MRTVYFDTNIFGDFADGTILQDQFDSLKKAVAAGRIRIVYSMALMDEQAKHCITKNWGKRAVQLARELCCHQGVRFHVNILKDEICAVLKGRKLPSIFMATNGDDDKDYEQIWKQLVNNPAGLDLKEWVAQEDDHQTDFNGGMKAAKAELETLSKQHGKVEKFTFEQWRDDQFVDDFTKGAIYQSLGRSALRYADQPERKWKTLLKRIDNATATRMYLDIHLAYSYALLVDNTSTKRPFSKDLLHAMYASRTDAFVTNDKQLRTIFTLVPSGKRPPVHSWETFNHAILTKVI